MQAPNPKTAQNKESDKHKNKILKYHSRNTHGINVNNKFMSLCFDSYDRQSFCQKISNDEKSRFCVQSTIIFAFEFKNECKNCIIEKYNFFTTSMRTLNFLPLAAVA